MKHFIRIFVLFIFFGINIFTTPYALSNESGFNDKQEKSVLVEFIQKMEAKVDLVQERIEFLRSSEENEKRPMTLLFDYLAAGEARFNPLWAFFSIFSIFIGVFVVEKLFFKYMIPFKGRLILNSPVPFQTKLGQQMIIAGVEVVSMVFFIVMSVLCFYGFFGQTPGLHILLITYLAAIVFVRLTLIISRFFLAPKASELRFLPMGNNTARYLYQWVTSISIVASFGLLTCGLLKLSGTSEVTHLKAIFMIAMIIAGMLIVMIFLRRKQVAQALLENLPAEGLRARLAKRWHYIAIFFVFMLLAASAVNMIFGTQGEYRAIKTLVMIPAYFLVDWILLNIIRILFSFVPNEEPAPENKAKKEKKTEFKDEVIEKRILMSVEFERIKHVIVPAFRWVLFALFCVWTLNIWGVELPVGKVVAKASFNILVVLLVCYVMWEFLNIIIQKRLKIEMPDQDEDMEEGGAGGSRVGTLLLLLRKFLMIFIAGMAVMIILSAMGVNIGPLIAGAGVVGLAIGFGAQTLVKDIISGIFFLIDDAFRVGDYIKVGTTKGMVEQISIRSFKLRHPRGMLNTIPFGDIASVTNFSRDYIITKLDFRVRYDTDVEKVRKIIKKKIHKVILKNEDLAPKLLGKIKSQGVRQLEDSAMIMRVKFKTIPGEQFSIRKEVYRLLQEAFKEEGIEFAHKNVTVYIPPEAEQSRGAIDNETRKKQIAAAAGAEEQSVQ